MSKAEQSDSGLLDGIVFRESAIDQGAAVTALLRPDSIFLPSQAVVGLISDDGEHIQSQSISVHGSQPTHAQSRYSHCAGDSAADTTVIKPALIRSLYRCHSLSTVFAFLRKNRLVSLAPDWRLPGVLAEPLSRLYLSDLQRISLYLQLGNFAGKRCFTVAELNNFSKRLNDQFDKFLPSSPEISAASFSSNYGKLQPNQILFDLVEKRLVNSQNELYILSEVLELGGGGLGDSARAESLADAGHFALLQLSTDARRYGLGEDSLEILLADRLLEYQWLCAVEHSDASPELIYAAGEEYTSWLREVDTRYLKTILRRCEVYKQSSERIELEFDFPPLRAPKDIVAAKIEMSTGASQAIRIYNGADD